jgi:phosphatidylserine/phosphatidylglycerophosphate/cardiolipin synthase-like enzyme
MQQPVTAPAPLSRRSYGRLCVATSWEEIWEAGNYYERVAELLEDARHSIVLVGWQIDSRLPMRRPRRVPGSNTDAPSIETLKQKIIRLCDSKPDLQVYILMWDHAWFYVYEREVWQGRIWENIHPRVHFVFDSRHPLGASHHEKLCLIDGRVALCGGIDLCDERWDTRAHLHHDSRRSLDLKEEHHGPYHDLAVQVSGPICLEIHRHIAERWERISSIPFPQEPKFPQNASGHSVYFSRTLARIDIERGQPHVTREVEFLYRELIDRAQKRLILEGQYYWSREFNDLLIRKIQKMRGRDFEIILILADLRKVKSLTRVMTQYELRLLDRLVVAAQAANVRLTLGMPYSYPLENTQGPARPVYVHSKTVIVDDHFLSIGSANFAARAFRLDSEVNLTFEARTDAERRHIENFGNRLLAHWHTGTVELRPISPAMLLHHGRGSNRWFEPPSPNFTWIAWEKFFDPEISPLYPLKRWLRHWNSDRTPVQRAIGKIALTCLAAALVLFFSGTGHTPDMQLRSIAYALLLCASWALPVPFLPTALYCVIDLSHLAHLAHLAHLTRSDVAASIKIPIISFWLVSLLGYLAARMFPSRAGLLYGNLRQSTLARYLGKRFFPSLLLAVFDPAVPLHYKIIYEGIYCLPLAWFALVNGLILPSVLYGLLSVWNWVWAIAASPRLIELISELALPWMIIMFFIGVARRSKVDIHHAKKAENSVLQHS